MILVCDQCGQEFSLEDVYQGVNDKKPRVECPHCGRRFFLTFQPDNGEKERLTMLWRFNPADKGLSPEFPLKITFSLPDWAAEKPLHLFAGYELLAYKDKRKNIVEQKKNRCNQCGTCCIDLSDNFTFPIIQGVCTHLVNERGTGKYICSLGMFRPFGCSAAEPHFREYCSITHEERDLEGNLL